MPANICGAVVVEDGLKPAGRAVVLGSTSSPSAVPNHLTALTDEDGRFYFDSVGAGAWQFWVRDSRECMVGWARIEVEDNTLTDLTILLREADINDVGEPAGSGIHATTARYDADDPGDDDASRSSRRDSLNETNGNDHGSDTPVSSGTLRGTVVRGGDGFPVADAAVMIVAGSRAVPDVAALTDSQGRFVLDGLAGGDWLLRALAPSGESGEAFFSLPGLNCEALVIRVD